MRLPRHWSFLLEMANARRTAYVGLGLTFTGFAPWLLGLWPR